MVMGLLLSSVKLEIPSTPGWWCCRNITLRPGPCRAFHCSTRRCRVRLLRHHDHLFSSVRFALPQPAPLFDPAKHLLNPAAGVDRLGVALMPCGSAIDRGTTRACAVLGHVRCHGDAAHVGLRDPASDDQGMAVVHQPMAPVARQGGVGIRRPGQQRDRIDAGAMGLVAELDATEVALGVCCT